MPMDPGEQYDRIYRYCYFKLRDRELAEDMTQETFLRYLERYQCDSVQEAVRCLYTIARHLCVDEYRRHKPVSLTGMQERQDGDRNLQTAYGEGSNEEEQTLLRLAVRKALAVLEEEEQELLLLRYGNEVSPATIGKLLGISRFAVYRRLTAASRKFKEQLGKEGF